MRLEHTARLLQNDDKSSRTEGRVSALPSLIFGQCPKKCPRAGPEDAGLPCLRSNTDEDDGSATILGSGPGTVRLARAGRAL